LKSHRGSLEDFAIFSLHPYLYTRTMLLMIWDFLVDRVEAVLDLVRRKKPKLTRSIKFSFLRALVNAFLRESSTYFVIEDIVRGIPVIYANYLGYDMVAHYSGPNSWDALNTLTGIDRQIKKIARMIAKKADKHFDLVILSDHGQAASMPFKNLFKKSLREVIEEHLETRLAEPSGHGAELGYLNTLLREVRMVEEAYGTRSIRRGRRTLERLHSRIHPDDVEQRGEEGIVVCASGNLAHVYFTQEPKRVTTEHLIEKYPTLLEYLVSHGGVGFLITTNNEGENLVMGRHGMRKLRSGVVEGGDPIDRFTTSGGQALVIRALMELCNYPNSGDLIINGNLLDDGTVVTFEAQRGTHGGLGGEQTDAFVIFPRRFRTRRDPVQSPAEMHRFLSRLLAPGAEIVSSP
ncbi:MAG: alkaline phosphatase family protein, partial [Candidatus Krumholzibacteria bacterium]|nr:alkaline phosphatase family protein [Candidatus Krumholzibacteria bacterium]